ncbi:MAG: caspase family protein [Nitrospirota bacterium]
MGTPRLLRLALLSGFIVPGLLLTACAPDIPPPALSFPVKEQEVPAVVAIGPIDVGKVTYEGAPLSDAVETTIQGILKDSLARTQVLKDVVILKLPGQKLDPEQILAAARAQNADLLLVAEVKEFSYDLPTFLFGSQYEVNLRLQAKLFNVHTGGQVWKRTENVSVRKDGSGVKRQESLDAIVRYVAVPPAAAGVLPPLVEYVQTEYLASLKAPGKGQAVAEGSEVFGAAELARIDAELAPPASAVPPKEAAYAVVIGIEDYRDLPRVDYARRDAETIKQYLVRALGYREQNIVLLLNDRVTRSALEARFEEWLPNQVGQNAGAEVFVYYGGHGAPDPKTNQAFLVPYDGDPAFLSRTAYPLKRLYESLGKLPAKQITVVMDSCFSGAGGRSVIAKGARPMLIQVENPLMSTQNMVVISAAAGNQISSAFPEKRHGLFTYHFLKGLQGAADANKDGAVDVGELYSYVKPHVETDARRMNAEQSPQLLPGPDLLGDRGKAHMIDLKR